MEAIQQRFQVDNVGAHLAGALQAARRAFWLRAGASPAPTRDGGGSVPSRGDPLRSPGRWWEANFDHPYLDAYGALQAAATTSIRHSHTLRHHDHHLF